MVTYIKSSIFIDTDYSMRSETSLSDNRELFLNLKFIFDEKRQCHCSGSVDLKERSGNKILETHLINEFIFSGSGYFLGAWDKICEKKGVSYNLADQISLKEFGEVANEPILTFSIFPNGVLISSQISTVTMCPIPGNKDEI